MATHSRIRSPSYPSLSLRKAIDGVAKIYEVYRTSPVDRLSAAKLIGFSTLSGPASSALGALRGYGLMEIAGKGTSIVTERAKKILFPEDESQRLECLIEAANSPPIFQEIRQTFADHDVPPKQGIISLLNRKELSTKAVKIATRSFIETAEFIVEEKRKVSGSAEIATNEDAELRKLGDNATADKAIEIRVGSLVQWESQGVLQFSEPRRIRHISEDGDWVFVDDSETGIPMNEVTVIQGTQQKMIPPSLPLPTHQVNETEWMHSRIGRNTGVRVLVSGDMGPKEIQRLMRVLQTQYDILTEDDEPQD